MAIPKVHFGWFIAKLLLAPDKEKPAAVGTQKPTFCTHLSSFSQVAVAARASPVVVVDTKAVCRTDGLITGEIKEARCRRCAASPRCPSCSCPHCGWRLCGGGSGSSRFRSGCKDPWEEPGTRPWRDLSFDQKFSVASFDSRKRSELKGNKETQIQ